MNDLLDAGTRAIARAVRGRQVSAADIARAALARIEESRILNAFTDVFDDTLLADAARLDAAIAGGAEPGPLAGVPFAVKALLDVAGRTTHAGSRIHAGRPPARADAVTVARLKDAGALLVGATNMDEYGYGGTTENSHYGTTRNPLDPTRLAGGSSGGSAAAVAGGLVPLALGSDTLGSVRLPASLCGIYGLRPTLGRIPRVGALAFSPSLDTVGPFARSAADLAATFDALQAPAAEPVSAALLNGAGGLRIAVAGDFFARDRGPAAAAAVAAVAARLSADREVVLPEADLARAAAATIAAAEGALQHLDDLRTSAAMFDPRTRDRFLAGALVPAAWYLKAQRFVRWYRQQVAALFDDVDVVVAPATPRVAPPLGATTITIDRQEVPIGPALGLFTQPLAPLGYPVLTMPVRSPESLPIGVQLLAAPYHEDLLLRAAAAFEAA